MKKTDRSYRSDKRRKEIEKQKKQEAKRQKRFQKSQGDDVNEDAPEMNSPEDEGSRGDDRADE